MDAHPFLSAIGRVLLKALLFPILTTLVLLEPIVSFVCCFMMLGGALAAIVFEFSAVGPKFPFLLIAGISIGFGVLLAVYHALLMVLLRD